MKKLLYLVLIVGIFVIAYSAKIVETKFANTTEKSKPIVGPDCKATFERKCYGGSVLVLFPGQVTDAIEANQFCANQSITCSQAECVARISVLAGIVAGSPKPDSCLPAGFRGK